jgi:hypothetical protein
MDAVRPNLMLPYSTKQGVTKATSEFFVRFVSYLNLLASGTTRARF